MVHKFEVFETKHLKIFSRQYYSEDCIAVQPSQVYEIICGEGQRWRDWFIPTSAWGYANPLASLIGLRLPKVKCFCLCGVFDKDESSGFMIGGKTYVYINDGHTMLHFFANDTKLAYWNNYGHLQVSVTRKV